MAKAKKKVTGKKAKKAAAKPAAKAAAKKAKQTAAREFTARQAIEITATFKDTAGLTARVAAAVAAENVNIRAATGYSAHAMYRKAVFTLIVDDFLKAEKALERMGASDVEESSVILVDMVNKVGALERAATVIANAGINIFYFYATTSAGKSATCVFKTADDKRAITLLNKA
jgi:hypothetical protein